MSQGFINIQPANVQLTGLKQTEAGNGILLRFLECDGQETDVQVTLDKSFVHNLPNARQLDVIEREVAGPVQWEDNKLSFKIPAHGIVTIGLFPDPAD